ncbi:MAG: hypothetical protein VX938_10335, partial [Myxococcota bacterium]|nr:hypothetical protein [Myxococcota bacterium]
MRLLTPGSGGERPRSFMVPLTVFTVLLVALEMRFFYLQILHGEDYRERARISVIDKERIPPRRGRILDRDGRVLAENVAIHTLRLTPHYISDPEERARVLERLQGLLGWSDADKAVLDTRILEQLDRRRRWESIRVPGELVADTSPVDGKRLVPLNKPLRQLVCPTDSSLYQSVESKATYCPIDRSDGVTINERLVWDGDKRLFATCPRSGRQFTSGSRCRDSGRALIPLEKNLKDVRTGDLHSNDVAAVRAVLYDLPGVDVVTEFKRHYPFGYEAAHLIGYMNRVTREDRK